MLEAPMRYDSAVLIDRQAYDSHCNLVLGDVEETVYVVEEDEEGDETVKVCWARRMWSARNALMGTMLIYLYRQFTRNQRCYLCEVSAGRASLFPSKPIFELC